MNPRLLPKNIANKLTVEWRPILNYMESAPNLPDLNEAKNSSHFMQMEILLTIQ